MLPHNCLILYFKATITPLWGDFLYFHGIFKSLNYADEMAENGFGIRKKNMILLPLPHMLFCFCDEEFFSMTPCSHSPNDGNNWIVFFHCQQHSISLKSHLRPWQNTSIIKRFIDIALSQHFETSHLKFSGPSECCFAFVPTNRRSLPLTY